MKSNSEFRGKSHSVASDDVYKKATKLQPNKKSGKVKRAVILALDEEDDIDLTAYRKRESALDYYDDDLEDTVLDEIDRLEEQEDEQFEGLDDVGEEEWERYDNYETDYENEWEKIQEFDDEAQLDNY